MRCPLLVVWATRDDLEELYGDPLEVWRDWAVDLSGLRLDSGHHMAEEVPREVAAAVLDLCQASRPSTSPNTA